MTRWKPDSHVRLEEAALALYGEHGFESTTVAEIAARAGLTERTFFRHYADKRDVLFGGSQIFEQLLVDAVAAAPASCSPIEAVGEALTQAGAVLQGRREFALKRQAIIASSPELTERERVKLASITVAIARALGERGVAEPAASLAAEVGIAVLRVAVDRWVRDGGEPELGELIRESIGELRAVTA